MAAPAPGHQLTDRVAGGSPTDAEERPRRSSSTALGGEAIRPRTRRPARPEPIRRTSPGCSSRPTSARTGRQRGGRSRPRLSSFVSLTHVARWRPSQISPSSSDAVSEAMLALGVRATELGPAIDLSVRRVPRRRPRLRSLTGRSRRSRRSGMSVQPPADGSSVISQSAAAVSAVSFVVTARWSSPG